MLVFLPSPARVGFDGLGLSYAKMVGSSRGTSVIPETDNSGFDRN